MSVFNQSRSHFIRLLFLLTFLIIIGQLFYLQIIEGKYRQLAMNQAVSPQIIYPERGLIFDKRGKAILSNNIAYDLMVTPTEIKGIDTADFCKTFEIDIEEFKRRVQEARFRGSPVLPSVFMGLVSESFQARFTENSWKFPGFALVDRPLRSYPFNAAAHILGYIKEVSPKDIERSGNFYRMGDYIGKTGLESYYEKILMGQRGVEYLLKDNKGRLVGKYENGSFDTAAIAGRGLRTYIDIELQELAEKLMTDKMGAVVALDPKTGGILTMVSGPNYNPNDLTGTVGSKNFGRMQLDVTSPFLNRAIGGLYEPGSTFKPIGGLIALDEGVITPNYGFSCFGRYTLCGHGKPACTHHNAGHARNLRVAIANSCNSYFAHIYRLTVDNPKYKKVKLGYIKWKEYLNSFGLGVRLGVDLPGENSGSIADTAVYNKENNNRWSSCTNLTLGIGQDKMQTTALQMANAIAIIANRGYYYTPHFVQKIDGETADDSTIVSKFRKKHNVFSNIPDSAFTAVIEGMADVVKVGTATSVRLPNIEVCAKTGTAENYTILDGRKIQLKDNSMFVCFAPKENPKIVVAVFVQNGGFGATAAGPIAKALMEKYLNDSLSAKSVVEVERVAKMNLMPPYFKRLQFKTDSVRAYKWLELYKDSSLLKKFLPLHGALPAPRPKKPLPPAQPTVPKAALDTLKNNNIKKNNSTR